MSSIVGATPAYVILVNEDNTMTTTQKKRIMQRSKLVDDLWFLVSPKYNNLNMEQFTVSLEYILPVSKRYRHEILSLSSDAYNGYLKYLLPFDTSLTEEPGDIELMVSFICVDLNENGVSIQRVRKVSSTNITIHPVTAWSDIIPDNVLSALDQRIIMTNAQINALNEMSNTLFNNKADNIKYDKEYNSIQLTAGGIEIGDKVVLGVTSESIKDGIPAVDFSIIDDSANDSVSDSEDNVVEF